MKIEDKVAMMDLALWLPHLKRHLAEDISHVSTFEDIVKLSIAQIGFTWGVVIKII